VQCYAPSALITPDAPPPPAHPLSLHDALPIYHKVVGREALQLRQHGLGAAQAGLIGHGVAGFEDLDAWRAVQGRWSGRHMAVSRSEEHTSALQSREKLVCRLLLGHNQLP